MTRSEQTAGKVAEVRAAYGDIEATLFRQGIEWADGHPLWHKVADGDLPDTARLVLTIEHVESLCMMTVQYYNPTNGLWAGCKTTDDKVDYWMDIPCESIPEYRRRNSKGR